MDNVKEFIFDYIQREYSLPEDVDPMQFNYVESGYIDSMGMIMFIASIEDEFGIEFSDEDTSDSRIQVIGSLIEMIEQKISEE